jgi:UV DNA damage endonuclease
LLDIHHTWCREGEYLYPSDDRFKRVIDSWRGVRPVIHYSYSRDEALPAGFSHDTFPDMKQLLEAGHKKAKLRAHSDWYPNPIVNEYALSFLEHADIMCESKMKNLASIELYNYANTVSSTKTEHRLVDVQQSKDRTSTEAELIA